MRVERVVVDTNVLISFALKPEGVAGQAVEAVEKPSKPPFCEIIGPRKYPKSKQAWHATNRSIKA